MDKESIYHLLLSDCLLSTIFDEKFWVQNMTFRISIQPVIYLIEMSMWLHNRAPISVFPWG